MKLKFLKNKGVQNGIWLYVLLFVNTVLPMLTIPYITRTLGTEQYGFYSIALNWINYLHVIVTYGFDMVGSRYTAQNKEDFPKLQTYFSSVIYAKLILSVISALAMVFLLMGSNNSQTLNICIFLLFGSVLGEAFKQTWLFQGLQVMKNITIVSASARILSTLAIFAFVRHDGLFLYCILYSLSGLFIGLFGMFITHSRLKIRLTRVSLKEIVLRYREGFAIFTTNAMTKVFSGFALTLLGMTSTPALVGVYSAIHKLPSIAISCFTPISQAMYPSICKLYQDDSARARKTTLKIGLIVIPLFAICALVAIILQEVVVELIFGTEYLIMSKLMLPFMIWVILSIINNFLGTQTLIASGHSRAYSVSFFIGFACLIGSTLVFGVLFDVMGVAWAQVFSEIVLICSNFVAILITEGKTRKNIASNC